MAKWYKTSEQLPEFPSDKVNIVYVQALKLPNGEVYPLAYRRSVFAKTEKGRAPRFEHISGHISYIPDLWAYMDSPPEELLHGLRG